jgi:hypothetical protein
MFDSLSRGRAALVDSIAFDRECPAVLSVNHQASGALHPGIALVRGVDARADEVRAFVLPTESGRDVRIIALVSFGHFVSFRVKHALVSNPLRSASVEAVRAS